MAEAYDGNRISLAHFLYTIGQSAYFENGMWESVNVGDDMGLTVRIWLSKYTPRHCNEISGGTYTNTTIPFYDTEHFLSIACERVSRAPHYVGYMI